MTEISRVSTLALHTTTINNFTKVQGDLSVLQDQISSGFKGRDFEAYDGQVEQLTGLEKEVKKLQSYIENNAETVSRLTTVENAVGELVEITSSIEALMTGQNPANANDAVFQAQIIQLRFAVADELNISLEGRYLFGGTRTDVPPVIDDPSVPSTVVSGVPDDVYYQGSKQNVTARAQDNVQFDYEARADDPAFQKLFAGLSLAVESGGANTDRVKFNQAQDLVAEAKQEIIALQARVSARRVDVDRIVTRQQDTQLYFSGVLDTILNVDTIAAASRVAIDEATLTATFQVFARASSLRLSDFL